MNLYEYTAGQLHEKLVKKECSATEITNATFTKIDDCEDKVGAYITLCKESALVTAGEVDKAIANGETIAPLAGIPIGIKDNISTQGILTTCASKMLYNYTPPYNATVMENLIKNKVVITGKLNMDEFAMGSSCETSYFKKTANPHNLDYVAGGSSGGSAAAVAAGQAVLSLGSDTGGSIRQPASYCGIIGLKPTYGSVSRYGLVAFASSLDQIGPMGRSVADVANLYQLLCGRDVKDATSVNRQYPNFAKELKGDVNGLRIGIPAEYFGAGVDPKIAELVHKSLATLESRGAKLVPVNLPSTDAALSAYYIISSAEASSNLARFDGVRYGFRAEEFDGLNDMYEKTRSQGFGDEVKRRIMLGTFVLSSGYFDAYYNRAKLLQKQIYQEFTEAFSICDILATPTTPTTSFKIGEKINDPLQMYANDICTIAVNIAGLPAISLPCGTVNNMPVGLQLIGPKFSEQTLFNTSYALEQEKDGLCKVATL